MIKNHPQAQEALDKGYVEIIHQYREVKNGFSSSGKKNVENAIHEKINLVCIKELPGVRTKTANIIAERQLLREIVIDGVFLGAYRIIDTYNKKLVSAISSESLGA